MESKRGRISGSSNWSKGSGNAEGKGRRSTELAGTQKCQRSTKVLRPCQLLQEVYKKLCQDSSTTTYTGQEGAAMKMGKGTEEGIQKT